MPEEQKPKTGVELITQERERQIAREGWTPEHDDAHDGGEMTKAARCYIPTSFDGELPDSPPEEWPWGWEWWKPSPDPIRNLVKAGALIAAEIDRLQRSAKAEGRDA